MKKFILPLVVLFLSVTIIPTGLADELEEMMINQIQKYNKDSYIEEYQVLITDGDGYIVSPKNELSTIFKELEQSGDYNPPEIYEFKILSRSDIENLTSVTYEYQQEDGKVTGIGIYMKTNDGYVSIYDAIIAPLSD